MTNFQLGEIVIITKSDYSNWPVGMEVEILALPGCDPTWPHAYQIGWETVPHLGRRRVVAPEHCLRRRNWPREQLGSWDEISVATAWRPERVSA